MKKRLASALLTLLFAVAAGGCSTVNLQPVRVLGAREPGPARERPPAAPPQPRALGHALGRAELHQRRARAHVVQP
mgnify:CR=1 FL=1